MAKEQRVSFTVRDGATFTVLVSGIVAMRHPSADSPAADAGTVVIAFPGGAGWSTYDFRNEKERKRVEAAWHANTVAFGGAREKKEL